MKKLLLLLFFFTLGASETIFYSPQGDVHISENNCTKTVEDIKRLYGNRDYQTITLEKGEMYKIENKVLRKLTKDELNKIAEEDNVRTMIKRKEKELRRRGAIRELKREGKLSNNYEE